MKALKLTAGNSSAGANSRRVFLKNGAIISLAATVGPLFKLSPLVVATPVKEYINGIQIGMASFADEGVDTIVPLLVLSP